MKYTDILIDLDDTLIDTAENTRLTLSEIYADYGLGNYFPSFNDFYTIYYTNVIQLWDLYGRGRITKKTLQRERFVGALSTVEDIDDEKALVINDDFIERIMKKDTLVEGAKELLDYLQPQYNIHILSNGFTEMQYTKMESAGLSDYFDKVILSDMVGVNKPHPDIFAFALTEIEARIDEVIMIGDNLFADIEGAYDSGLDQIWYNPRNKPCDNVQPTYVVNRLVDIKSIL